MRRHALTASLTLPDSSSLRAASGSAEQYIPRRGRVPSRALSASFLKSSRAYLPDLIDRRCSLSSGSGRIARPKSEKPESAKRLRTMSDLMECIACFVSYPCLSTNICVDSVPRSSLCIFPS